jgi:hypothetical protein
LRGVNLMVTTGNLNFADLYTFLVHLLKKLN